MPAINRAGGGALLDVPKHLRGKGFTTVRDRLPTVEFVVDCRQDAGDVSVGRDLFPEVTGVVAE
jgi:hypothetical protein